MRLSRRHALAGLGGFGGLALLQVVGRPATAQDASPGPSGEWTFTDDVGKSVTLPEPPRRVVADLNAAAALWDFDIRSEAVSGWAVGTDAAWGNIDRATPDITADAGGPDPNLEELLEIKPDLFVTVVWGPDETTYPWSFSDEERYERVNEIVPVVGISATGLADANMERFAALAGLLGADLSTPDLVAAKAALDERVETFSALAQEKADLTVLFGTAGEEGIYYANPEDWADLAWFQALGLNIIAPDVEKGAYWEKLSAEQAGKYESDLFLASAGAGTYTLEDMQAHPLYKTLPAVAAGQVASWNQDAIQSYQGLAAALDVVITALENAEKVTA